MKKQSAKKMFENVLGLSSDMMERRNDFRW